MPLAKQLETHPHHSGNDHSDGRFAKKSSISMR